MVTKRRPVTAADGESVRDPTRGTLLLVGVSLAVAIISGLTYVVATLTQTEPWQTLWFLFDAGREHNVPTWYASILWAALGVCALLALQLSGRRRGSWAMLAAVAFVLSVDEYAELHERLDVIGTRVASALGLQLWFTWVIPGLVLALVVAAALLRLVLALDAVPQRMLLVGGALFVAGAFGFETLSGLVLGSFGGEVTWHYVLVTLVEETFELVGLSVAIGGLLHLFEWRSAQGLDVRFVGWRNDTRPAGRAVGGGDGAAR